MAALKDYKPPGCVMMTREGRAPIPTTDQGAKEDEHHDGG